MAAPSSRTAAPTTGNPSAPPASRTRDWSSLKSGEPGSAFRDISRGRGAPRGSPRGGRGGARLPNNTNTRGGGKSSASEPTGSRAPEPNAGRSKPEPKVNAKAASQPATTKVSAEKPPASPARPRAAPRRASRGAPALVVVPTSPTENSVSNTPTTPSRSSNRRRRSHQQGKGSSVNTPKINASQNLRPEQPLPSSSSSTSALVKDVPPHLAAAHQAEIKHDIDALVERVRAVAMAENRPTTPGSHIDWAGDDDDSLPDLDDWGVTTTHAKNVGKQDEISPILADALRPLPEPHAEIHVDGENEETQSVEVDDIAYSEEMSEPLLPNSSPPTSLGDDPISAAASVHEATPAEPISELIKPPLHPSLPPKPISVIESSVHHNLPAKPAPASVDDEPITSKIDGLAQSIHAIPSSDKVEKDEPLTRSTSLQHGLSASIHAPKGIPESHSTPTLLPSHPSASTSPPPRGTHNRAHTEGRLGFRQQPHTAPANVASHRFSRSGASSPLSAHVYPHHGGHGHGRNHSTPPAAGHRSGQSTRPVITVDAISRLARTIGNLGPGAPVPKASAGITVAKE